MKVYGASSVVVVASCQTPITPILSPRYATSTTLELQFSGFDIFFFTGLYGVPVGISIFTNWNSDSWVRRFVGRDLLADMRVLDEGYFSH